VKEEENRPPPTGLVGRLLNPYFFAFLGGILTLTLLRACWS